jgi:exodeoxyribonuclease V alpha subunit
MSNSETKRNSETNPERPREGGRYVADGNSATRNGAVGDGELLEAIIERFTFRNEENGFAVMKVQVRSSSSPDAPKSLAVVGVVASTLSTGSTFVARGIFQDHPKFGKQFRAFSITEKAPTSSEEILRYLSSGAVKGIGPVLADRIVSKFGEKTLEVFDDEPEKLREIPGLGGKKYHELVETWREGREDREVTVFLHGLGLSPALSERIRKQYGKRAIELISEDPYFLIDDLWGVGFMRADMIGSGLGIEKSSPQRVRAGLQHELKRSADDGHCYLPPETLVRRAAKLLGLEEGEIRSVLEMAIAERLFIVEDERIYTPHLYGAEKALAGRLAAFIANLSAPAPEISDDTAKQLAIERITVIGASGSPSVITLSSQQERAIHEAAKHSLLVITGGPGCGKTTVVRTLVRMFQREQLNLKLAAPTGRAAQRLAEVCGLEASTIHRLLKFDPQTRAFLHNSEEPLDLDVLIVDESSMIDVLLASALLNAVPYGARLIIVGDADQLPSVGPGLFLADLLKMDEVPCVQLTSLFRRDIQSYITTIAHEINSGIVSEIPSPDGLTKSEAYFLPVESPEKGAELVERLVVDQIPRKFGFVPTDIAVLSPMNQGELGVINLNKRLQAQLRPSDEFQARVKSGELELRIGDRVCQRVNNYQLSEAGVFNGEQGEIIGIDAEAGAVFIKFWDGREVRYDSSSIPQLDLAYAISVHRSQGSEVPVVVLVVHDSHAILLERQLLYTGVTRAKRLLIVVGTRRAYALAVKKTRSKNRFTSLVERMRNLLVEFD